jgi:KDO2-lipid IV(A) lauroyltransferase
VPVERVEPPELFEFLQRERQSKGIHAVPAESAAREMLRGLGRGEMVAIAGDRQTAGRGVPVTLFGKRTHFPGSPASLARRSQAVVLLGVGVRLSNDRFAGFIEAPLRFQRTDNREDDLIANTQRLADAMQGYIRRYPDQWLVFTPVWPTEIDRVATIEQPRGAAV